MGTSLHNLLVVEDNPFIGQKIVDAVKKFSSIQTVYKSETIEEAFAFLKKTTLKRKFLFSLHIPSLNRFV
ncbi:hypothetical protein GCM10011416_12750 [Polaribacter pacificus]|uniref:Response regulatory domain-containing protein n=1 Tax=Polaribacter pacificus TaxID=1775173 RepID=A0A917MDR3_9FLAO|nr:hypothetical protein [Polaribacter pacificus]GGG96438.1 hypothetical protein GCM10011416_12750 [Polaribacter pacificus]